MSEGPKSNALLERIKQIKEANAKNAQPQIRVPDSPPLETIKERVREITKVDIEKKEIEIKPVEKVSPRKRIRARMDEILKEYGGVYSNIPPNSPYFALQRRLRVTK